MSRDFNASPNPTRYKRSRTDRVIAGVCGGIADRFGWDPTVVRILAVVGFFFMFGPLIIMAYIVTWLITPSRTRADYSQSGNAEEAAFWRGVSDSPRATFGNLKYTYMDLEERLRRLERDVTSDEWRLRKAFKDLEQN
ncbi:MAG: envelope stress response membrane protein PspC [Pseudomonadota bacterium]